MTDFYSLHAREKLGLPDDWQWYHLEHADSPYGPFIRVTGAVAPPLKSGPRKGKPNWAKRDPATERTADLTPAEHEAFVARWEQTTGECADCDGTGQSPFGYSREQGRMTRPCRKCGATGKAPAAKETA